MLSLLRRVFNILVRSEALRYIVIPTSADTVAAVAITTTAAAGAWTWGNYAQIAATVGTADVQLTGLTLENLVGAAGLQGEIQIASGAAASEVPLVTVQLARAQIDFDTPIRIPSGTRVAARLRTSTGAADTVDVKLNAKTGF